MIIVSSNDIPGSRIVSTVGGCVGITVRSRHWGSNLAAGWKEIAGGELHGITKLLQESREEALGRLADNAKELGGNAVIAFRFDTNEYENIGLEVCAYGTAVVIEPDA